MAPNKEETEETEETERLDMTPEMKARRRKVTWGTQTIHRYE